MVLTLLPMFAGLLVVLALTPLIVRGAEARGWVDKPDDGRRSHKMPVPRLGGIAVLGGLTAGLITAEVLTPWLPELANPEQYATIRYVLFGGGLVFLVGLSDDLFTLAPRVKLLLTAIIAAGLWYAGFRIESLGLPSSRAFPVGILSFPLTVIWVTGMTHALNLIDGLDGLASGVSLVALVTAAASAVLLGHPGALTAAAVLAAVMAGFLWFNRHPARVFLGDCGSLALGAMLAIITVRSADGGGGHVLFVIPLLALAYPLLDTGLSMMRRWLRGVSFSVADRRHIHHQLLSLVPSYRWAVGTLYLCSAALATLGLLLTFAPQSLVAAIALVGGSMFTILVVVGVRWLGYHEFLEAAGSILSVFRSARHVIRDKILARDLCIGFENARTLRHLSAIISENAGQFGFVRMELQRDPSPIAKTSGRTSGKLSRTWSLEYPVRSAVVPRVNFVLRIWCDINEGSRPYGAERVARLLVPAIEVWLERVYAEELAAEVERESPLTAIAEVGKHARPGSSSHYAASFEHAN